MQSKEEIVYNYDLWKFLIHIIKCNGEDVVAKEFSVSSRLVFRWIIRNAIPNKKILKKIHSMYNETIGK